MDDRIKIGDVWYVKEEKTVEWEEPEIMYSKQMQIDVEDKSLVASCLTDEKLTEHKMVSIDVKTIDHNTLLECMDNEGWLKLVVKRDEVALSELNDSSPAVSEAIILLCDKMQELKWI